MARQTAPGTVDPNVDPETAPDTGEVTTMDGLFDKPEVVDEVVEVGLPAEADEPEGGWWIIRPNADIEHMSVGTVDNSYAFEAGRRYKVPFDVMSILAHRDYLLEVPTPFKP